MSAQVVIGVLYKNKQVLLEVLTAVKISMLVRVNSYMCVSEKKQHTASVLMASSNSPIFSALRNFSQCLLHSILSLYCRFKTMSSCRGLTFLSDCLKIKF
jgi:hypothetical protein